MDGFRRRWWGPSRWLQAARADGGGLLVPGHPAADAVDLCLRPDAVVVGDAGGPTVALPWEHCVALFVQERELSGDSWGIGHLYVADNRAYGVGARSSGAYEDRTAPLRAATQTPRNRWGRFATRAQVLVHPVTAVPLDARMTTGGRAVLDMRAAQVVAGVLAQRPALRPALAEPARVERLLSDIRSVRLRIHRLPTGVRRETVEVLATMRVLGLTHDLGGRPVPGDAVIGEDDAVARILARLAENPYAEGVAIDEPDVRALVREHLTEVAPWPLHALVD